MIPKLSQHITCRKGGSWRTRSHFEHSASQLLTRLVGQQITTRFASGTPPNKACPPWSIVHSSVIPCNAGNPWKFKSERDFQFKCLTKD